MTDIAAAIKAINPSAQVSVNSEDLDQITWHVGDVIPKADIQAKQAELQAAYDAKAYARTRAEAYPSVEDFIEAYTEKEIDSNSAKWDAYVINRNKVRTDNPK